MLHSAQVNTPTFRARALLFDMDGTLIDSSANIERAYRWWAAGHSLPIDAILAVQRGRPHREVMRQFAPVLDLDLESKRFTEFETADREGMPLIPGVLDAIRVAQGGRWAVVTSSKRQLAEMRFAVTQLPMPRALVSSEMIRHGKPNPECYLLAATLVETAPSECIVFEDAVAGVEAGHSAGMSVVGINTGGDLSGPDLLVRDFTEIEIRPDPDGWFSIRKRPDC